MLKKKKGFTLIELLVVVAIIAVLAGLVIIRIGNTSADARNAKRKSDLNQIRTAIEQAKNSGAGVNTTGCSAYPCTRNLADTIFNATAPAKQPATFLSGGVFPTDPAGANYQLRLTNATSPSINYILVSPASDDGAEILVSG
jgi:prepilin-type N-terminal cleavage/methylation domain-containing protein